MGHSAVCRFFVISMCMANTAPCIYGICLLCESITIQSKRRNYSFAQCVCAWPTNANINTNMYWWYWIVNSTSVCLWLCDFMWFFFASRCVFEHFRSCIWTLHLCGCSYQTYRTQYPEPWEIKMYTVPYMHSRNRVNISLFLFIIVFVYSYANWNGLCIFRFEADRRHHSPTQHIQNTQAFTPTHMTIWLLLISFPYSFENVIGANSFNEYYYFFPQTYSVRLWSSVSINSIDTTFTNAILTKHSLFCFARHLSATTATISSIAVRRA